MVVRSIPFGRSTPHGNQRCTTAVAPRLKQSCTQPASHYSRSHVRTKSDSHHFDLYKATSQRTWLFSFTQHASDASEPAAAPPIAEYSSCQHILVFWS